jgi:hypothetical protein
MESCVCRVEAVEVFVVYRGRDSKRLLLFLKVDIERNELQ